MSGKSTGIDGFLPKNIEELRANREKFVNSLNELVQKSTLVYGAVIGNKEKFPSAFLIEALDSKGLSDRSVQVLLTEREKRESEASNKTPQQRIGETSKKIDEVVQIVCELEIKTEKAKESASNIGRELEKNGPDLERLKRANAEKDVEIQDLEDDETEEEEFVDDLLLENAKLTAQLAQKKLLRNCAYLSCGLGILGIFAFLFVKRK